MIRLGDLLEVVIDHRGKTPKKLGFDYSQRGVPVLSAKVVINGTLDLAEVKHVSPEVWRAWMRTPTRQGDVLLTSEAPLGRLARIPSDEPFVLGQRLFGLRGKGGVLDNRFLFYALQYSVVQDQLRYRATGSTVTGIRQSALMDLTLDLPSWDEQRAIAEVLGALDDKIAANERLVRLGDQLSMALYEQALGGGDHVELSSLATFVNGRAFTRGATGTGRLVVRIAELNNGPSASTIYNELDVAEEHLARPGDLLFAWSGSLAVRRWFRNEAIVNQHIFKVVPRGQPAWLIKMALLRELPNFKAIATGKATTMGHIQRKHLDVAVEIPAEDRVRRIDTAMTALSDLALSAERESLVVAELRDTLLPALMSGRIRVKDAEKTASEVV